MSRILRQFVGKWQGANFDNMHYCKISKGYAQKGMDPVVHELYALLQAKIHGRHDKLAEFLRLLPGKSESWRTKFTRYDKSGPQHLTISDAIVLCDALGESLPELLIAAKLQANAKVGSPLDRSAGGTGGGARQKKRHAA